LASAVLRGGISPVSLHVLLAESAAPHDRTESRIDLAEEVQIALERSVQAAKAWGHRVLDTEHILFGIIAGPTSVDEILSSLRISPTDIVNALTSLQQSAPAAVVRDEATHAYRLTLESAWVLSLAVDTARGLGRRQSCGCLLIAPASAGKTLYVTFWLKLSASRGPVAAALTPISLVHRHEVVAARCRPSADPRLWVVRRNRGHLAVTPLHLAMALARAEHHASRCPPSGRPHADLVDALATAMPPTTLK
jgi:hypothetical protein